MSPNYNLLSSQLTCSSHPLEFTDPINITNSLTWPFWFLTTWISTQLYITGQEPYYIFLVNSLCHSSGWFIFIIIVSIQIFNTHTSFSLSHDDFVSYLLGKYNHFEYISSSSHYHMHELVYIFIYFILWLLKRGYAFNRLLSKANFLLVHKTFPSPFSHSTKAYVPTSLVHWICSD